MKISAPIARLAIAGRTPSEADLIDRISSFAAKDPHSFLGSGAFLALGRRLAAAGVQPVDGEQVDITPYAGSITVEEAKAALLRTAASSVCERVALVVAEQAQLPVGGISPTTILDKIGFDSLGLIELVLALEERFEIDIPEDMKELETVKTVEDITKVVERVLARPALPAAVPPKSVEHTQLGLPSINQGLDPARVAVAAAMEPSAEAASLADDLWSYKPSEFRNYASALAVAKFITVNYKLSQR